MKRILFLIIGLAMAIMLTGCGDKALNPLTLLPSGEMVEVKGHVLKDTAGNEYMLKKVIFNIFNVHKL